MHDVYDPSNISKPSFQEGELSIILPESAVLYVQVDASSELVKLLAMCGFVFFGSGHPPAHGPMYHWLWEPAWSDRVRRQIVCFIWHPHKFQGSATCHCVEIVKVNCCQSYYYYPWGRKPAKFKKGNFGLSKWHAHVIVWMKKCPAHTHSSATSHHVLPRCYVMSCLNSEILTALK